jgi:hypothetical protein
MSTDKTYHLEDKVRAVIRHSERDLTRYANDLEISLSLNRAKYSDGYIESKKQYEANLVKYSMDCLESQIVRLNNVLGQLKELS